MSKGLRKKQLGIFPAAGDDYMPDSAAYPRGRLGSVGYDAALRKGGFAIEKL